jgi:hypothetical protein
MQIRPSYVCALSALALSMIGCNVGDAPSGPSQAEYQKSLDNMTPDQRIKWIESSPLNPDQKAKEIAAIKAKAGIK